MLGVYASAYDDNIAMVERMRRNAVQLDFGRGCRCCYDPNQDGGEYGTLREMRLQLSHEKMEREKSARGGGCGCDDSVDKSPKVPKSISADSDDDSEFDYLLDEAELPGSNAQDMERYRRQELESVMSYRELLNHHGYGVHRQLHPMRLIHSTGLVPTRIRAMTEFSCVLHLYDPNSEMSAALDVLLDNEARWGVYFGTKFVRGSGRTVLLMNPELASKELPGIDPEKDVPVLIAIRNGVVVATCPRLAGLGDEGAGTVDAGKVEDWLRAAGVLCSDPPPREHVCRVRPEDDALLASGILGEKGNDYFTCDVPGCEKTFYHEHFDTAGKGT